MWAEPFLGIPTINMQHFDTLPDEGQAVMKSYFKDNVIAAADWIDNRNANDRAKIEEEKPEIVWTEWDDEYRNIAGEGAVEALEILLFPTRRSSDLKQKTAYRFSGVTGVQTCALPIRSEEHTSELQSLRRISYAVFCLRSEEHTSELQSLRRISYAVFCLKKKKKKTSNKLIILINKKKKKI